MGVTGVTRRWKWNKLSKILFRGGPTSNTKIGRNLPRNIKSPNLSSVSRLWFWRMHLTKSTSWQGIPQPPAGHFAQKGPECFGAGHPETAETHSKSSKRPVISRWGVAVGSYMFIYSLIEGDECPDRGLLNQAVSQGWLFSRSRPSSQWWRSSPPGSPRVHRWGGPLWHPNWTSCAPECSSTCPARTGPPDMEGLSQALRETLYMVSWRLFTRCPTHPGFGGSAWLTKLNCPLLQPSCIEIKASRTHGNVRNYATKTARIFDRIRASKSVRIIAKIYVR